MTENETRASTILIGEGVSNKEPSEEMRFLIALINWKRQYLARKGLAPRRVYMHYKTARILYGGLHTPNMVTVIPKGRERVATVCGLEIIECGSLPPGKVDIGCDEME